MIDQPPVLQSQQLPPSQHIGCHFSLGIAAIQTFANSHFADGKQEGCRTHGQKKVTLREVACYIGNVLIRQFRVPVQALTFASYIILSKSFNQSERQFPHLYTRVITLPHRTVLGLNEIPDSKHPPPGSGTQHVPKKCEFLSPAAFSVFFVHKNKVKSYFPSSGSPKLYPSPSNGILTFCHL